MIIRRVSCKFKHYRCLSWLVCLIQSQSSSSNTQPSGPSQLCAMTEAAPSTFTPAVVDPPLSKQASQTLSPAKQPLDDQPPISTLSNGAHHSDIALPPAAKVLANGDNSHPLRALCARLHSQIKAFLEENTKNARLQAVQAQTRRSLQIIQEALDRYPYFPIFLSSFPSPPSLSYVLHTPAVNLY